MGSGFEVRFPGGKRVDVAFGGFVVPTDQPAELGGAGEAPAPFDLYLASLAACAGIYALGFCQARGMATDGLSLRQDVVYDPATHLPTAVDLVVTPPLGFPPEKLPALLRAVEHCKVKKSLLSPPAFSVRAAEAA